MILVALTLRPSAVEGNHRSAWETGRMGRAGDGIRVARRSPAVSREVAAGDAATAAAFRDPRARVTTFAPDVPPEFERIVMRLLEKEAEKRIPDATGVDPAVDRVAGDLKPTPPRSVAARQGPRQTPFLCPPSELAGGSKRLGSGRQYKPRRDDAGRQRGTAIGSAADE